MSSVLYRQESPIEVANSAVRRGMWAYLIAFLLALLLCAGCAGFPTPTITTSQLPNARPGQAYAAALSATGGIRPYRWAVTSGALPPGVNLEAHTGALSGVPSQIGSFGFTVRVADSSIVKPETDARPLAMVVGIPPLEITTSSLPNAQQGIQFQSGVAAVGGVQPYHWSVASGILPSGISLTADSGILSGKASQGGPFDFSMQVSDSSSPNPQTTMKALKLAVVAFALQITPGGLPNGQVGTPFEASFTGNGGITPYTWTTSGALPSGLNLSASSGVIAGTPTQAGTSTFTILLTDSAGQTAQKSASITIAVGSGSLAITTTALPKPTVGHAYSQTLQATGGTPPYTWSVASGTLPSGVSLNADNGILSGKPSQGGQFDFSMRVSDSSSPNPQTTMKPLRLAVVAFALEIAPGGLPNGQVGTPFEASFTGNGGVTPYSWTVTGALPSGLSLNASSGAIAGTPTQAGTSAFTILLTDSVGQTAQKSSSITIAAGSGSLAISTTALPKPTVGQAYSQTLQATGGTPPYTWSVASGKLPTALTLVAGQMAGKPSAEGEFHFTIQVADSASPPQTASQAFNLSVSEASAWPATDQYGGILAVVSPNGATGNWRVEKFGKRWLFVTPEGHGFYMLGVSDVDTDTSIPSTGVSNDAIILSKYGTKEIWAAQTNARLKSWGFNTLGDYSTYYVASTPHPFGNTYPPTKIPGVGIMNFARASLRNTNNLAPQPTKDLVNGTDPGVYNGYRGGTTPDVYDPSFNTYALAHPSDYIGASILATSLSSPWLIGMEVDDTDGLYGFGPSCVINTGYAHAHISWLILVGNHAQAGNARLGFPTYTDTKVYSKYAMRDFLKTRYNNSISALNTAWGSNYTTFDSAGGWGVGTGFLDEKGLNSWVGTDPYCLAGETAAMKADLDDFLYQFAVKYFSVVTGAMRAQNAATLVFSPDVLNTWGGLARKQILQAAGLYCDVLVANAGSATDAITGQQILDFSATWAGDRPMVTFSGFTANPDSSLFRAPNPAGAQLTQAARATAWSNQILYEYGLHTTFGGVFMIAGTKLWRYVDSWSEQLNWGLTSFQDNPYNGVSAVVRKGTDEDGYPTGGEERDYGDYISGVTKLNRAIQNNLLLGRW